MKSRVAACVSVAAGFGVVGVPVASAIDVSTTSANHNHRFEYWGTSLAWWGNEVGGQSNADGREELIDLFFDPNNGLGMNFVRYNIGAGSNPDTSIQNITRPGAVMDGWVPTEPTDETDPDTWVWDWNADATQRLILDMAIDHGVTNVEAFANSAPWWMTRNEQSNGISGGGSNLSRFRDDEFAHYMLEVVEHFQDNLGIQFETLAPMNEPGSGFWNGNSNQEGMGVPAGFFQDELIKEFGESIEDRGLDIKLVGLEETSTDQSADSWTNPNLTDEAKAYIKQFNTHTYGFNGSSLQSDSERLYEEVTVTDGLKIYATEYGTGQGATRLARQIMSDIRYLDAAGWTYWQAIEDNNGSGWGLAISNFNGNNPEHDIQDQYFAFKQFSAHVRPGSEIIELDGQDNILAAYDPRTGQTVLVVNNENAGDTSEQYSFDLLDRDVELTRLIRTTDEDNSFRTDAYQSLGAATVNGNNVTFDSVGDSVTTLVISHQENLIQNGNFDLNGGANGVTAIPNWQSSGDAAFDTGSDHSFDVTGTGTARLETQGDAVGGRIFQTGIGDADTDLTGVAFQLSADVRFLNAGSREYDADTYLALEFYGADDETLTSIALEDYETLIESAPGVKANGSESSVSGSDPNDSEYRTYFSGRFIAPEGTRYVRPVLRFDSVEGENSAFTFIDNAWLQVVHPEADAREWNVVGGGTWGDGDNWSNNASIEKNAFAYFGNAINEASEVSVFETQSVDGITFFSDHEYRLRVRGSDNPTLQIGNAGSGLDAQIDVRWGSHRISTATTVFDDLTIQVLPDANLQIDNGFDANGFEVRKLGAGTLDFALGFDLNGGTLSAYASADAKINFGGDAILNGDFELLLAPGQVLELGDIFELASYEGTMDDTFNNIILPELSSELAWAVDYGNTLLTASIVSAIIAGDYNGDGFVSQADLDLVLLNWGSSDLPTGWVAADQFDGEIVSQNELDGVLLNWGNGTPPNINAIPEPGLATLFGAFVIAFAPRRRGQRNA